MNEETERPRIDLNPGQVICSYHGGVFREKWPSGYTPFVLIGLKEVMAQDEFHKEVGGKTELVGEALDRVPICCRLTRSRLHAVFVQVQEQCGVWVVDTCDSCKQKEAGCRFTMSRGKRVYTYNHICVKCIANREVQ